MLRALLVAAGGAALSLTRRRLVVVRGLESLTPRQRQVLAALARGRQLKEIAHDLGISEATVKTHLRKSCDRLGASTRSEAVARYVAATRGRR